MPPSDTTTAAPGNLHGRGPSGSGHEARCRPNGPVRATLVLDSLVHAEDIPPTEYAGYESRFVFGEGGHSLRHGGAIFADSLRWLAG